MNPEMETPDKDTGAVPKATDRHLLRDLALLGLVLFFLWRNGEHDQRIGWTFQHAWADIALGIGLFPVVLIGAGLLDAAVKI